MGVIQRQVFKNNLLSFVGIAIGAVTNVFIFPQDPALKGYADTVLRAAMLFAPICLLGLPLVIIHFYPYLKGSTETAVAKLLARTLAIGGGIVASMVLTNYLLGDMVFVALAERGVSIEKLQSSSWIVIGLVAALMGTAVINTVLSIYRRIAIPVLFNNVFLKIALPAIFLFSVYGHLDRGGFAWALVVIYLLSLFGLTVYGKTIGALNLKWGKLELESRSVKEMFSVAGFSILGTLGSVFAIYLDTLFVNFYLGDTPTGYYGFAVFAVSLMMVPHKAMVTIATPIITEKFKADEMSEISNLYQDSARTLFIIGAFILAGLVICLPTLYQLTPKLQQYSVGYTATIFLALGVLTDQITSINGQLIGFSRYFRIGPVFTLILGGINVVLNYLFIGKLGYGLMGAAMATALSLTIYNVIKSGFVYWKFRLHPFTISNLYTLLLGSFAIFTGLLIPDVGVVFVDLVLKAGWIVLCFGLLIMATSAAPVLKSAITGKVREVFDRFRG